MTKVEKKHPSDYEVGYRKPPAHRRFHFAQIA
jgi:hypothetical protein